MLFEKIFSGGHSSKEMHSNQYAVGSVSQRTFGQRKRIEQSRSRIAAYRHSKLGWSVAPRSAYKKPQLSASEGKDASAIKSDNTPPPRNYQEPPVRNYNPYS